MFSPTRFVARGLLSSNLKRVLRLGDLYGMAFQAAMINATESLLAPRAVASTAASGGQSSGLFQMLLAGANAEGADAPALQANTASPVASANSSGAIALLLQTTEATAVPANDPAAADFAQTAFAPTPAEAGTQAPIGDKPGEGAAQTTGAIPVASEPNVTEQGEAPVAQAISPKTPAPQTPNPQTLAEIVTGEAIVATTNESGDQIAAATPTQTTATTPDVAMAIVFAPFVTQSATPTATKPTQPAAGEAIDSDQPAAPSTANLFKKAAFGANPGKANTGGVSTAAFRAATAEALAAPQGQQQRTESALPGSTSPISGFEAPRAAADAISTPVARAPHGAAAMQIAQSITRNFHGASKNFEVRLDPAELGRVDVKISVDHDKRVTASVSADNPQTLTDLRGAARDIERALNEAGLDLAQGGLSFEMNQREANDEQFDASSYAAAKEEGGSETLTPSARPFGMQRWSSSGVDVWA